MSKWPVGALLVIFTSNIAPVVFSVVELLIAGDIWGGNLPQLATASFVLVITAGLIGLIASAVVCYQLMFNSKYDGRKTPIRGTFFPAIFYTGATILCAFSTAHFKQQPCDQPNLVSYWGQTVYDEGIQAYSNFCHVCKCHIREDSLYEYPSLQLQSLNYDTTYGADDVSQCRLHEGQLTTPTFHKLKTMETNLQCSGFCNTNFIFAFAGTNDGSPHEKQGCFGLVNSKVSNMLLVPAIMSGCMVGLYIVGYFIGMHQRECLLKKLLADSGFNEQTNSLSLLSHGEEWKNIKSNETNQLSDHLSQLHNQQQHHHHNYHQNNNINYQNTISNIQQNNSNVNSTNNLNNASTQCADAATEEGQKKQRRMRELKQAFRSLHDPRNSLSKK